MLPGREREREMVVVREEKKVHGDKKRSLHHSRRFELSWS